MRLTESILTKLNESEGFKEKLEGIFDNVSEEKEYNGFEINNSGICISDYLFDENGDKQDGIMFYSHPSKHVVFPEVGSPSSFDIQAPKFLKDNSGKEYGDTIQFAGVKEDSKIKELFDELNNAKKEYDPKNKDEDGYSKIIESSLKEESKYSNIEDDDPILDKTIKVYDINEYVDKEINNDNEETKYRSFDFNNGAAIIIASDGSGCIVDYEAIGNGFNSTSDSIFLNLCPVDGDDGNGHKTFSIMATARIKVTIDELLTAPSKEMKVRDFFYKWDYNDRCARNFEEIKGYLQEGAAIKESASSPAEYYIICKEDFQKLLDQNGGVFDKGYVAITKNEANAIAKKQGLVINDNGVFSNEDGEE